MGLEKSRKISESKISRRDILKISSIGVCTFVMSPLTGSPSKSKIRVGPEKQNLVEIENEFIHLSEGTRLAARIWMPSTASSKKPVPAILEYIPYRKRDMYRESDDRIQPLLARYGYAVVRVDIRGTGDSDGVLTDEYTKQEQDDAVELIAWLSNQVWCNGNVGMKGISWGGINALQVAARNPPELKAIVAHCFTDDRFGGDEHYMGGCLLVENFSWGSYFLGVLSMPPDPEIVGEVWKDEWLKRLHSVEPVMATKWLENQFKNKYWKQGSVSEDYSAIKCPVFAVGGHVDPYTDTVAKLLENLKVPCRGLVGPWGHTYPDMASPGPAIGFEEYSVNWWDHWLKGTETNLSEIPKLATYIQTETAGKVTPDDVPGYWIAEDSWPKKHAETIEYAITAKGLIKDSELASEIVQLKPDQTIGLNGGSWIGGISNDQREDDSKSLTFDTPILKEDVEIVGNPQLEISLSVDKPMAFIVVRLNEVEPDGSSWRVCKSARNLAHRVNLSSPLPIEPGRFYTIKLDLGFTAYNFKAGNRLRLSISTSYWPMIWPSPEPVSLEIQTGRGSLSLPTRGTINRCSRAPLYPNAGAQVDAKHTSITKGKYTNDVHYDPIEGIHEITKKWESGERNLHPIDTVKSSSGSEIVKISAGNPLSASYVVTQEVALSRDDWDISLRSSAEITATKENFNIEIQLEAIHKEKKIFCKSWKKSVKRIYV
ncbi:CocE/NonD family hydrolase [Porticoccaceae bacterium]|nr:CocE/NonD family hydrolase [Porticoccaceae bacterium]